MRANHRSFDWNQALTTPEFLEFLVTGGKETTVRASEEPRWGALPEACQVHTAAGWVRPWWRLWLTCDYCQSHWKGGSVYLYPQQLETESWDRGWNLSDRLLSMSVKMSLLPTLLTLADRSCLGLSRLVFGEGQSALGWERMKAPEQSRTERQGGSLGHRLRLCIQPRWKPVSPPLGSHVGEILHLLFCLSWFSWGSVTGNQKVLMQILLQPIQIPKWLLIGPWLKHILKHSKNRILLSHWKW